MNKLKPQVEVFADETTHGKVSVARIAYNNLHCYELEVDTDSQQDVGWYRNNMQRLEGILEEELQALHDLIGEMLAKRDEGSDVDLADGDEDDEDAVDDTPVIPDNISRYPERDVVLPIGAKVYLTLDNGRAIPVENIGKGDVFTTHLSDFGTYFIAQLDAVKHKGGYNLVTVRTTLEHRPEGISSLDMTGLVKFKLPHQVDLATGGRWVPILANRLQKDNYFRTSPGNVVWKVSSVFTEDNGDLWVTASEVY